MSAAAVIALVSAFILFMISLGSAERRTRNLVPQRVPVRASIRAARP